MEQMSTIKREENQQTEFIGTLTRCDRRCNEILDDFRILATSHGWINFQLYTRIDELVHWLVRIKFIRARDARLEYIIEIKAFIKLLYLASLYRRKHLNLDDLWDNNGDRIEKFRLTMSQSPFRFLIRCIRSVNERQEYRGENLTDLHLYETFF